MAEEEELRRVREEKRKSGKGGWDGLKEEVWLSRRGGVRRKEGRG